MAEQTIDQMKARIAELEAAAIRRQPATSIKVSTKGGVSVYGLGRFPVSLYKSQWLKVIALVKSGELEKFMAANDSALAVKV